MEAFSTPRVDTDAEAPPLSINLAMPSMLLFAYKSLMGIVWPVISISLSQSKGWSCARTGGMTVAVGAELGFGGGRRCIGKELRTARCTGRGGTGSIFDAFIRGGDDVKRSTRIRMLERLSHKDTSKRTHHQWQVAAPSHRRRSAQSPQRN